MERLMFYSASVFNFLKIFFKKGNRNIRAPQPDTFRSWQNEALLFIRIDVLRQYKVVL